MEISEFEKKRAANLIWNGAQDYTIATGFRVYDSEGKAELYWNSIVGAIHKHYDWKKLKLFYNTFHETVDQTVYESLFWIALENATFLREKDQRPVFPYLRKEYATRELPHVKPGISHSRADVIFLGHLRHSIGQNAGLPDPVDVKLLDAIEIGPELDTDGVIDSISNTLSTYFTYRKPGEKKEGEKKEHVNPFSLFFLRRRKKGDAGNLGPVRRLAFGYGEHVDEYGSAVLDQSHLSVAFAAYSAQTDEGLKEYITNYFGKSVLDDKTTKDWEKTYCNGNHTDVHLHITRGDYTDDMLEKGYAGKMKKQAIAQAKANEEAFEANIQHYHTQIEKLTERIRNSMLVHLDDQTVKSSYDRLNAGRVWRALELDDDRVFDHVIRGDAGNLTVDILLDASTSQIHRQETVSAQGYMIAQALTACHIPVRVYSFCSMNGYTIVNIFRDYNETDRNRKIFSYSTTGANRDGLAIRLSAGMMKENHADHRILIVLSDCKPNDVIKVRTGSGQYRDYAADLGVSDTATEVHAARMQGINVLCVFTEEDSALKNCQKIYGRDFVRIRSLNLFADAVGSMLQNRIRML